MSQLSIGGWNNFLGTCVHRLLQAVALQSKWMCVSMYVDGWMDGWIDVCLCAFGVCVYGCESITHHMARSRSTLKEITKVGGSQLQPSDTHEAMKWLVLAWIRHDWPSWNKFAASLPAVCALARSLLSVSSDEDGEGERERRRTRSLARSPPHSTKNLSHLLLISSCYKRKLSSWVTQLLVPFFVMQWGCCLRWEGCVLSLTCLDSIYLFHHFTAEGKKKNVPFFRYFVHSLLLSLSFPHKILRCVLVHSTAACSFIDC